MAFDDVTFFEVHLDDARFGRTDERKDDESTSAEEDQQETTGRSLPKLIVIGLILAGVATLIASRLLREEDADHAPIEIDSDAPEIEK